jgi:hypothetical protein
MLVGRTGRVHCAMSNEYYLILSMACLLRQLESLRKLYALS